MNLNNQSILITGGTGSFGKNFIKIVLEKYPQISRLVVYSRDEMKQYEMMEHHPYGKHPALEFCMGDIRDAERIKQACKGIDYIIHVAALKHVHLAEINPLEYIKTNILGAENVIQAAIHNKVKKVVALSSDKATSASNLYGATKFCADKLFIAANFVPYPTDTIFSTVRYGNVMGSRGSVLPFFLGKRQEGYLPITDPRMTRFNISPGEEVNTVLYALENSLGGEILVPKLPSFKITDLALAVAPACEQKIVGIRAGEKLHEEMINETDAPYTIENQQYFIIIPNPVLLKNKLQSFYLENHQAKFVPADFVYHSENNKDWLDIGMIRNLIMQHIDPNFQIL